MGSWRLQKQDETENFSFVWLYPEISFCAFQLMLDHITYSFQYGLEALNKVINMGALLFKSPNQVHD